MRPQRAAAALGQYLEISAGLRGLDDSERIFLIWNLKVGGIVAGDLEKYSGIRASFIGLTCRVQEAGTKAQASRDPLLVAYGMPQFLQDGLVLRVHLNEAKQSEVVSCCEPIEMSPQIAGE